MGWAWAWAWAWAWVMVVMVAVMVRWVWAASVVGACMYVAVKVAEVLWWKPKRLEKHFAEQGIRGPPYRFLVGCVREMVGLMLDASSKPMLPQTSHNILPRVLAFYHHWKKIYGSTFLIWFGPTARLTIAEPELIREILLSRSEYFDRYESHPLVRQLEGEGLVSLRGEKWAHHRKVLTPTFHMDNLKLLIPYIGKTVVDMADKWATMSAAAGEVEIDVSEWFQIVTEDAITRTAFGRSYEDGKAVFQLQTQLMGFASEAFRKVLIPGYRFLPTRKNTSSWKLDKEIRKHLVRLIGRRKEDSDSASAGEKPDGRAKDLLGLMINARPPSLAGKGKDCDRSAAAITVHDIVEECKTFFFAGKQTTSNLLTWTTVLLAMHPEWQERARAEVLSVCGSRALPTRDHLAKLKTVGMILNETLRLYPPAVATIRRAKADVELGGYVIPRDTEVLIPIMGVHHDARLWGPDAAQFNPGRFAEGVARAARHPTAFIPFGLGARMCIGQNLALLEAKLTVAIILQRFVFRLAPTYVHAPTVLMLLYPQYGAPVVFRPLPPDPSDPPAAPRYR
ncbi:Cytochrome P450 734A6 [Ananas comosus]|uniref:Cytochrome P450 734A6 n=1 Tax=Ananas comosus TaxID=4615 RepID=A0A199VL21_ANACO|nr:Cytochrome P450 734A6 [Ananas comosus]